MFYEDIKFNDIGLIPAIVQDYKSGEVLMQAYMNKESLSRTMETGYTWFFSRSRDELWEKGATSGNTQEVKEIFLDCDGDSLLIKVKQKGVACHTGSRSCFYRSMWTAPEAGSAASFAAVTEELYKKVEERKENPVPGSYTCYLFEQGIDKILKKLGEESTEVVIAAKNSDKKEVIYEISDLMYHLTVLMKYTGVTYEDIAEELLRRFK